MVQALKVLAIAAFVAPLLLLTGCHNSCSGKDGCPYDQSYSK